MPATNSFRIVLDIFGINADSIGIGPDSFRIDPDSFETALDSSVVILDSFWTLLDSFGIGLDFFGLSIEALKVLDSDKLLQGVPVSFTIFHSFFLTRPFCTNIALFETKGRYHENKFYL